MKLLKLLLSSLILTMMAFSLADAKETRAQIEARERARTEELNNQQAAKAAAATKGNATADTQVVAKPQPADYLDSTATGPDGKFVNAPPGCEVCEKQAAAVSLQDQTNPGKAPQVQSSTERGGQ